MALTNDDVLAQRLDVLRSHGINRDTIDDGKHSHGPWYYEQYFSATISPHDGHTGSTGHEPDHAPKTSTLTDGTKLPDGMMNGR